MGIIHTNRKKISVLLRGPFLNSIALPGSLIFVAAYLYIVYWFHITDVWNKHFFEDGPVYIFYNIFKVIYFLYFGWILYVIGQIIVRFVEQRNEITFSLSVLDSFLLSFYVGAAALRILMFLLGYLNLYYYIIAIFITAPVLLLSYPHLKTVILKGIQDIKSNNINRFQLAIFSILILIIFFISFLILSSKALYPTTDHDALTHYNNYYNEVVRNHGLWPNSVWYHYYYSKGSGLMFLSILLTDNQAPQLVSFSFFIISAFTLFSLIRKISNDAIWPLIAMILYLAVFVDTPGWAVFQKQHIVMTALLASVVWMTVMYLTRPANDQKGWTYLWGLLTIALIIFVPTSFAFVFPFFVFFTVVFLVIKNVKRAKSFASLASISLILLLFIMAINYMTTGMLEFTPFRIFWALASQAKFSEWVSPYMVLYLGEGSNPTMGIFSLVDFNTFEADVINWFVIIFRLYKVSYLFPYPTITLPLFLILIGSAIITKVRPKYHTTALIAPILVMIGIAAANSVIVNQPWSIFRLYVFTVFLVVLAAVILWKLFLDLVINPPLRQLLSYLIAGIMVYLTITDIYNTYNNEKLKAQLQFTLGQTSFKEAYTSLELPYYPGRETVYWQEAVKAREIIGAETRLWSFHSFAGIGAVPGRNIESEISYAYSGDWHSIVFADPEKAKEVLKKHEINYFLLDLNQPLFGALPYSPLFAPGNIEQYFEIAWNQGDVYLLTWRDENSQGMPIPTEASRIWAAKLSEPGNLRELYDRVKYYYDKYEARPYPVYADPNLPSVTGWQ